MMLGEILVTIGVLAICVVGVGWLLNDIDKQCKKFEEEQKNSNKNE